MHEPVWKGAFPGWSPGTGRPSPHGGTGVVAGVVQTDESRWPDYDPDDPSFLEDLRSTVLTPIRTGDTTRSSSAGSFRDSPAPGSPEP